MPNILPANALNAPGAAFAAMVASIAALMPCCSGGMIRVVDSYCLGVRKAITVATRRDHKATLARVWRRSQSNDVLGTHLAPLSATESSTRSSGGFNAV